MFPRQVLFHLYKYSTSAVRWWQFRASECLQAQMVGKDNLFVLQYRVRFASWRDSGCEKWFWAQKLRWRKFVVNLRRRMPRFKNREVAGVVYTAAGQNFSSNVCRFCSWWTLQKNVWNPKAVTKSIQRRLLQAASWEGIKICCHTALPNFPHNKPRENFLRPYSYFLIHSFIWWIWVW
jgi:hypothetical protein